MRNTPWSALCKTDPLSSEYGTDKTVIRLDAYSKRVSPLQVTLYTLHAISDTIHHTLYTVHRTLYTLHPSPCTLNSTPYTLLHFTPYALRPTPYALPFLALPYHARLQEVLDRFLQQIFSRNDS